MRHWLHVFEATTDGTHPQSFSQSVHKGCIEKKRRNKNKTENKKKGICKAFCVTRKRKKIKKVFKVFALHANALNLDLLR